MRDRPLSVGGEIKCRYLKQTQELRTYLRKAGICFRR